MAIQVRQLGLQASARWDEFVLRSPDATVCHTAAWQRALATGFPFGSCSLLAEDGGRVVGVLPLHLVRSLPQGRFLCSVPIGTYGGLLAESPPARDALLEAARTLGRRLRVRFIELRNTRPGCTNLPVKTVFSRAVLELDPDPGWVWRKRILSNVRTHVRRARKRGVAIVCGHDWLPAFHRVYQRNMHRLGSPAFGRGFLSAVAEEFGEALRCYCAVADRRVIGGLVTLDFRDTVWTVWSSSLRRYFNLSPNNLLYWTAIEEACRRERRWLDFGRSLRGSGPMRFKLQWGATERLLHYEYLVDAPEGVPHFDLTNPRAVALTRLWRRLPLPVTNRLGHWALSQVG